MGCNIGKREKIIYTRAPDTQFVDSEKPKVEESEKVKMSDLVKEKKSNVTDCYKIISKLGEGGFGSVYKVASNSTKLIRAMKVIKKESIEAQDDDKKFLKEIEVLMKLDHPSIVRIFEYFVDEHHFYVITEYVSGGELYDTIANWTVFYERNAAIIMRQLMSAVCYLHLSNVVHRDLKPENILIEKTTKTDDIRIKLIDFGTCNYLEEGNFLEHRVGTPYYIAPEVIKGKYNFACDIWSCGIILHCLLVGYPPFIGESTDEILEAVKKGNISLDKVEWVTVSDEAKALLKAMLTYDFSKRQSAKWCLDHSWIQSHSEKTKVDNKMLKSVMNNIKGFKAKQKLHKTAIAFIVHFFSDSEEIENLRNVFISIDDSGDGRLNYKELREGFARVFGETFTDIEFNRIIEEIDQDADGYIGYQEFLRVAMDQKILLRKKNLRAAFAYFDQNGDGSLSIDELKAIMGTSDNVFLEQTVAEIDLNNDGVINFEEFCTLMTGILERSVRSRSTFKPNTKSRLSVIDFHMNFNKRNTALGAANLFPNNVISEVEEENRT